MNTSTRSLKRMRKFGGEDGFTLIEVLVSLLIFSFGVLGLVGMQAKAIQVSTDAEDRMRASIMADEIIAAMWQAGTTALSSTAISAWQTRVNNTTVSGLPVPSSCSTCGGTITTSTDSVSGYPLALVTIVWLPPSRTTTSTYITQVIIPPAL